MTPGNMEKAQILDQQSLSLMAESIADKYETAIKKAFDNPINKNSRESIKADVLSYLEEKKPDLSESDSLSFLRKLAFFRLARKSKKYHFSKFNAGNSSNLDELKAEILETNKEYNSLKFLDQSSLNLSFDRNNKKENDSNE